MLPLVGLVVACGAQPARHPDAASVAASELLPTRVRRLTSVELERSVHALLGTTPDVAKKLPPDVRQQGYTPNVAQPFPAATAVRWASLVEEWTQDATRSNPRRFVACDTSACRDELVARFGRRAWRRSLTTEEHDALTALYEAGLATGSSADGAQLVLSALLQSPSFLYVTELGEQRGDTSNPDVTRLTASEIASALAYTLSGAPPDDELLDRAERGELVSPEQRRAAARRIIGRSSTRHQFRRFVLEWLEIDHLETTSKEPERHPRYERLKEHMLAETTAFTDEVMVHHGASVSALLSAGFSSVDPSMARYYGLEAFGPVVPLRGKPRVGVLQHASFLSAHSHPDGTSPVLRGDFVLRKVLCKELMRPSELGIEIIMPRPKEGETTRERFAAHTQSAQCRSCHSTIDPIGFVFEGFDEAGKERAEDGGKRVDTGGDVDLYGQKLHFDDSVALSRWLAGSPRTRECFSRQAFRYFSAQSDPGPERAFLSFVGELPRAKRDNLVEVLVEYAASPLFVARRVDASPNPGTGEGT